MSKKKIASLINDIEKIFESDIEWKDKYDQIFKIWSDELHNLIIENHIDFDWTDLDTSYEEDVSNLVRPLLELKEELEEELNMSGPELVDRFLQDERIYSFEGTRGVENLKKLLKALGYGQTHYLNADVILDFLADNSGASEAIVEWIKEQIETSEEWMDNLKCEDE